MSLRAKVEAHAAACREAAESGRERPRWMGDSLTNADLTDTDLTGADLTDTDLTDADLTAADLRGADLRGATLTGARLDEGVARGRAIGGHVGGYLWWAVGLKRGGAVLQYGCERHSLEWWLTQGPELAVHHGHPAEFWEQGPAVAIAAAQALASAG